MGERGENGRGGNVAKRLGRGGDGQSVGEGSERWRVAGVWWGALEGGKRREGGEKGGAGL